MMRSVRWRTAVLLAAVAAVAGATLPATAAPAPASALASGVVRAAAWKPVPSYAVAAHDEPVTYRNGCHAGKVVVTPRPCTFANAKGTRTVLLYGDSHAAHWHAAVLASAKAHNWRMLTLTKSSCPAADVAVRGYKGAKAYPQCSTWRSRALPAIAASRWGKVDVAVVSDWHFHSVLSSPRGRILSTTAKVAAWEAGMRRTLAKILKGAKQVVLLRDSPDLPGDALGARACFARYGLAAQKRCGTTTSRALNNRIWAAERRAAASFPGRVVVVDLTLPTCPKGWCGPIAKPYLAFKDDNHWTQTYMRAHFTAPLNKLLVVAMEKANPPVVVLTPTPIVPVTPLPVPPPSPV